MIETTTKPKSKIQFYYKDKNYLLNLKGLIENNNLYFCFYGRKKDCQFWFVIHDYLNYTFCEVYLWLLDNKPELEGRNIEDLLKDAYKGKLGFIQK